MDAFVLYRNYYEMINQMPTAEDQAAAYKALCGYMLDGIEPELDGMPALFFSYVKPSLDKNIQRAMNGRKGGRPKTKQNATKNKPDNNQNEPIKNQTETKTKPNHNQKQTETKPNETEIKPTENQTETKTKANKIINNKVINNKIINNEELLIQQSEAGTSSCSPKRQPAVTFGYDTDAKIHGITPELMEYWKTQFPAVDIEQEIRSAEAWLDSNRVKRKHDIKRFITSWLTRTQEKASARATTPQSNTYTQRRQYSGFDGNVHPAVSAEDREAYNGF
jgi:hypothetical protein